MSYIFADIFNKFILSTNYGQDTLKQYKWYYGLKKRERERDSHYSQEYYNLMKI